MPNIAIVWDFDGTLTPQCSTTKIVEILQGSGKGGEFWDFIKSVAGLKKAPTWEHILAMDAPIWMYSLSRLAWYKKVPLNSEFFREFVLPEITTYNNVISFLGAIKDIAKQPDFQALSIEIHHFIISAGLKELIEQVFPSQLITWTFGCRYAVIAHKGHESEPESIPVFCMDETTKTRSLFEISKGAFNNQNIKVNSRVSSESLWAPFENIIYIGDGDTDVPALSLTRSKGGLGVAVYDPAKPKADINKKLKDMRLDKRADLITAADFSLNSELYKFLHTRCVQIQQRYNAAQYLE